MAAYLVARTRVLDETAYAAYKAKGIEAIDLYGGQPVVGPDKQGVLEGEVTGVRHVVIRFDTLEAVKVFYASPEYDAARRLRERAAEVEMFFAERA